MQNDTRSLEPLHKLVKNNERTFYKGEKLSVPLDGVCVERTRHEREQMHYMHSSSSEQNDDMLD